MILEMKKKLAIAVSSQMPLDEIVTMLREYKKKGISEEEMTLALETLRATAETESDEDRILEIADFVSGFCSPHMKV